MELKRNYSKFIEGELIDLCVPDKQAIEEDGWADWFNDVQRLKNTAHGVFPNSNPVQYKVLESFAEDRTRMALLICDKGRRVAHGILALQSIDLFRRSAEIVIHMAPRKDPGIHRLAALEAMALISEHGFREMGLERIFAGQAFPSLRSWNKSLELIGFRTEGFSRAGFVRGHIVSDAVQISCLYADYLALVAERGALWGSLSTIKEAMQRQPPDSHAERVAEAHRRIEADYFKFLCSNGGKGSAQES